MRSAAGETPVRVFSLDTETLIRRRRELENAVLASSTTTRRALPESEHAIREVGEALFAALFGGPVYGRYEASLATAQERGEPLRVVLHVDAPELAALPWEAMFDPEHQGYLCQREPLVRQVPAPSPVAPLPVAGALRILAIVAGPEGLPHLDAQEEQRRLMEALAEPLAEGRVTVRWATTGTWRDVQGALLNGVWHVVHFIGHGGYNAETDEGVLAMVGPDGRKDLVGASRFAVLLSEAEPSPRLIVLNSCGSGESGTQRPVLEHRGRPGAKWGQRRRRHAVRRHRSGRPRVFPGLLHRSRRRARGRPGRAERTSGHPGHQRLHPGVGHTFALPPRRRDPSVRPQPGAVRLVIGHRRGTTGSRHAGHRADSGS